MVLPWGKYKYQKLPMGICNSPDTFQKIMNKLFNGLECILIINNSNIEEYFNRLKALIKKLKTAYIEVNTEKSFFAKIG